MANFAKLDENNKVVQVAVIHNNIVDNGDGTESEKKGQTFLRNLYKEPTAVWKQFSYNTNEGIYYIHVNGVKQAGPDQSKAFRKNSAGIDGTYDPNRDAFIPPKRYASWILNESTCIWEPPIPFPEFDPEVPDRAWTWDEPNVNWKIK